MKQVLLLDESLAVEVFYACEDADLEDNICIRVVESCPAEEKVFTHDESHLYLTREQARSLAAALLEAAGMSGEGK